MISSESPIEAPVSVASQMVSHSSCTSPEIPPEIARIRSSAATVFADFESTVSRGTPISRSIVRTGRRFAINRDVHKLFCLLDLCRRVVI